MIKTGHTINSRYLDTSMTYAEYRTLIDKLLAENKTTGTVQSEDYINYAKLNQSRMERIEKTLEVSEETKYSVSQLRKNYFLLILAEGWCGDAAQNIPAIQKIAETTPKLEVRILLRDENLELMDLFLTNGTRSIPKVLVVEKVSLQVVAEWGPRPAPAQQVMLDMKAKNASSEEKSKAIHVWYAMDKSQTLQKEFIHLFSTLPEFNYRNN